MAHDGEETLVPREEPCALCTVHIRPPVSCAITELRITSCVHVLGFLSVEFSAEVVSVTLDVCAEKKKSVRNCVCASVGTSERNVGCPAPPCPLPAQLAPIPGGDLCLCRCYLPIALPKVTGTPHTCIQEIKCYFSENGK